AASAARLLEALDPPAALRRLARERLARLGQLEPDRLRRLVRRLRESGPPGAAAKVPSRAG
ncbi:MAG TPA: hypothetical protein VLS49_08565, partial [Usitatibacter sp.]|nr:hypothetical protein [Usitatibacter sp.]